MMKIKKLLLAVSLLCVVSSNAEKTLLNTTRSSFNYLHDDVCVFDDQTNTVSCKKFGAFQNVKKVTSDTSQLQEGQLLGTMLGSDKKQYNVYAMSPEQAIAHKDDLLETIKATAAVLFNPVTPAFPGAAPKPNPYALDSHNGAAIDTLFGSKGLNVDKALIQYIKNFYFYLEYVTKLEYAARMLALAHQQNIDGITIIENKSWQDFVTQLESKVGNWNVLEKKLFGPAITPNWEGIKGLISASSWQDLVKTSFWKSLNGITTQSIINSSFWQKYVKYTITYSYVQDQKLLLSIKEVEKSIFKYIPNIEIAYYTPDFTSLRNAAEMFHIILILTDALRARYIPQCLEWQIFKDAQGKYDSKKVYTASLDFEKTPFYSIASSAQEDQSRVYASSADSKVPSNIKVDWFKQEPLLQEELLLLSMVKILHALMNYLYDSDHLETTMNILANKAINQPSPSIFIYAPEDYLYLEDLNLLHDSFTESVNVNAQKSPMPMARGPEQKRAQAKALFSAVLNNQKKYENPRVKVQNFWGDIWNDVTQGVIDIAGKLEDAIDKVGNDLEKLGGDITSLANDVKDAIVDEFEAIGVGTLALFMAAINPQAAKRLLQKAAKLQDEVKKNIDEGVANLDKTVSDIEDVSRDSLKVLETAMEGICDVSTANFDKEICKSLAGAFESAFEVVIDIIAGNIHSYLQFAGGIVKLTEDGILLVAHAASNIASGNYAGLEEGLLDDIKTMGADAAVAILAPLTTQFQYFMRTLGDSLKFCQYFISVITRLFIDATTAITYAIGVTIARIGNIFGANIDPSDWAKTVDDALTEHERVIGTALTTALLLATIPLTGGASIPLIAMTVGPQIFATYASYQADEEAIRQKEEEKTFIDHFTTYVTTNSFIYQVQQNEWSAELNDKYASELSNQERDLGFYENFLADNFEALKEQVASSLGSYWAQLLQPDTSYFNMVPADVGSLYGFTTGVYELNPSQGFSLYSAARKSFSQEIAVSPAVAVKQQDGALTKVAETKNWFNQKEVVLLKDAIDEIEVGFKGIYLLNSFYIGLYFGGQEINKDTVIKTENAPLDPAQLAKMAVYTRENEQSPVTFGIYEHEGKGWITQSAQAPQFKLGTWYRINMRLRGTDLQVKVWDEEHPDAGSSLSVTCSAPSPSQKVIGVISSGAAIEYQFMTPKVQAVANTDLRPKETFCSLPCDVKHPTWLPIQLEKERAKEAGKQLEYLMKPKIGTTKLEAVGKTQILRSQYMYNTQATKLMVDNKVVDDFIVTCSMEEVGTVATVAQGSIGSKPTAYSYLISLVSESVFDGNANSINMNLSNVYDSYVAQFGPLSDGLKQKIDGLRQKFVTQGSTLKFGSFALQIANRDIVKHNQYIYMAPMKDQKGTVIKDTTGKQPITDYFLLAVLNDSLTAFDRNKPGNPGISYSDWTASERKGVVSIVSGNLYTAKSMVAVKNYSADYIVNNYENNQKETNTQIPNELDAAIKQNQAAYQAAMHPQQGSTDIPNTGSGTKKTSSTDIAQKTEQKPVGKKTDVPVQKPAQQSEQQRTEQAGGGNISFGGPS